MQIQYEMNGHAETILEVLQKHNTKSEGFKKMPSQ